MPQQINLFTPILLTQKRYFSAQATLQAFALLVVFGGGLYALWIDGLGLAGEELKKTSASRSRELASLQLTIKQNQVGGAAVSTVQAQIQAQRDELLRVEKVIAASQEGLSQPGQGHAARLELLAQTIPANVWITKLSAQQRQLEISGLTSEPALIETWIDKLALHPMLKGQTLHTVKVESVSAEQQNTPRPVWAFSFTSGLTQAALTPEEKP